MTVRLPVDHVVVLVSDLRAAGHAFETAGFTVTPEARHSPEMGTANRCVMLAGAYVELMGVHIETPANAPWRKLLAEGPGVRGFALRSDDIKTTARDLAAKAIEADAVREFSRQTGEGTLRFAVQRIAPALTPGLQCLYCQHRTPDLLWQPHLLRHSNGATRLLEVQTLRFDALARLPREDGIAITDGPDRLVFAAGNAASHDLSETCGVQIELVPA